MPTFVDGVQINSVFVDGAEQDKIFADGVEVYTGEVSFDFVERALPQPSPVITAADVDPNGVFVGIGHTANGSDIYAVSSPDGIVFTERVTPRNLAADSSRHCKFANDRFYATGGNTDNDQTFFLEAFGESNWDLVPGYPPGFGSGGGIAYSPDDLIFVTCIGNSSYHSSPNALAPWTERTSPGVGSPINADTVYANGFFCNTGFVPGASADTAIDTSPNGINWTQLQVPNGEFDTTHFAAYNPELDRWVIVGTAMPNGDAYIITAESTPNTAWTLRPNPMPQNSVLRGVASIANFGFICVGQDVDAGQTAIIGISEDGITWERIITHPFEGVVISNYHRVMEFQGRIVIFGNLDGVSSFAVSN